MKKIFMILIGFGCLVYFICMTSNVIYNKDSLRLFLQYLNTFPDIYEDLKSVVINNVADITDGLTGKISSIADWLTLAKSVLLMLITPIQLLLHTIREFFDIFLWMFGLLSGTWLGGVL